MTAFYNEIDPYAAQWLRNLIQARHIAPGIVDERSIEDIVPDELREFTQCHFFAGIGVWSLALRRAGWDDSRPVWTGSCPCQPFSAAGKGAGFDDERHLWPAFHHLIAECHPELVLGEQVASKDADPWIDLVHADLEALGYAFGAVPFPSASVGAPHIRDRLYWVADATNSGRREERADVGGLAVGDRAQGVAAGLVHGGSPSGLAHTADDGQQRWWASKAGDGRNPARLEPERFCDAGDRAGPTNGFWRDADWLGCTDGKWRPVEPGTFPLAHGIGGGLGRVRADQERLAALVPRKDQGSRSGRLRGYGNAINAQQATLWIECVMESL